MKNVEARVMAYCQPPPRHMVNRFGSLNNCSFRVRKNCDICRFAQRRRNILKYFVRIMVADDAPIVSRLLSTTSTTSISQQTHQ